MAINFYIDNRTDKNGDSPIRVSIIIQGVRFITSMGQKINKTKWDNVKQQVRKGRNNSTGITYSVINSEISKITDFFTTYENELITTNKTTNKAIIQKLFSERFGRKKQLTKVGQRSVTFFDFFEQFKAEESAQNQWKDGTIKKFDTLKKHLEEYNANLTFADLNEKGITNFLAFLRDSKNHQNSTALKQLRLLKWFLRWSIKKGYNTNSDFQLYKPKLKTPPKPVHFLDWGELMKVFHYEIPANGENVKLRAYNGEEYTKTIHDRSALITTKDIFCFCCFTSLRYSDAVNLKWSNIENGAITITTIKTADTLKIELQDRASDILNKYKKRTDCKEFVFPHITNQRMNVYIKDICELCEINQPITITYHKGSERIDKTAPKYKYISTHAGRRTFVSNALMNKISPQIVMKWTGHSDYKAMMPYIDITDEAKATAMNKFNEL